MKILITGGNGFIGRHLQESLSGQHKVISCSRKELDLLDPDQVRDFIECNKFDVILHTANYDAAPKHSLKDPSKVLENNLKMFFNLVRCKGHFGKMIYFGSGAEFGREHWKPNMAEDYFDVHVPSDQYGFSKYLMTKYAIASDNIYNLRLFGVFGKYDDWRYRFIPNICARIALDLPLAISQNRAVDLLYVDDLVKMTNWLLKAKNAKKVYNACSGRAQDYLSLVDDVLRVSGKKADLTVMQNGIGREYSGDSSLILKDSGITLTPMPQALGELYNWYCINPGYVDKEQILNYPL